MPYVERKYDIGIMDDNERGGWIVLLTELYFWTYRSFQWYLNGGEDILM